MVERIRGTTGMERAEIETESTYNCQLRSDKIVSDLTDSHCFGVLARTLLIPMGELVTEVKVSCLDFNAV